VHADHGSEPDAYEVLGMAPESSAAHVRKCFWKVSLLIHPDKSDHPQAGKAFDAVTKAAQALRDTVRRADLDAKRDAAADAKLTDAAIADMEREREWRILQGRATAEDLKCASATRGWHVLGHHKLGTLALLSFQTLRTKNGSTFLAPVLSFGRMKYLSNW
jgi:curved DNA-binding protein CbpA